MTRPIRRVRGLAFFSLILLVGSLARAEAQLPKVRITLMPDVPYENVFGHCVLYGPFGERTRASYESQALGRFKSRL
jgi:hypothetical protein